ncbi:phosphorylase superfamily protein [Colletotrichum incanum]|nr:phosphorylase superfamily protein [Colletotrichum incanum]
MAPQLDAAKRLLVETMLTQGYDTKLVASKASCTLGSAPGDYNTYSTGRMGSHDVVLLLLPNMGKISAASAAASLRSSFTGIKLAILTGICGGVPGIGTSNEVFLGDVVISKSIMQYDLGRKYPNRFAPKDTIEDSLGRPNKEIRSLVTTFITLHGRSDLQRRASHVLGQIQQRATDEGHQNLYRRPPATEDRLFKPGYLTGTTTQDGTVGQEIRVVVGRVGSGDTVVKAGLDRDRIAGEHDLIAFEMEGAGVWEEIPCIIVKAVCDYADSHKNKKWQHFAAATAASTTKALLEHYAHMDSPLAPHTWFLVRREQQLGQSLKLRSRVAIYGLRGIGKTQIALAYTLWLLHERPDVSVFWVHASNTERFRQAYSSIAQECRSLMVIDNADDTQLFFPPSSQGGSIDTYSTAETQGGLARYIPECVHGSILITTRNKQTASRLVRGNSLPEIGGISESEASQLLHSILNDEVSSEEALNLSRRLEHLPLALTQAAAFMQENGISISKYIRLLDESDESLVDQLSEPFKAIGRDSETPHALTATWIVSFNQIQQQEALASDVLSFCSLLDRQGIPERLIKSKGDWLIMRNKRYG